MLMSLIRITKKGKRTMKRVKDLKVGDNVYILWEYGIMYEDWFTVEEIKKRGTLAIVKLSHEKHEAIAYGHVSSRYLSWFMKNGTWTDYPLTTDREEVQQLYDRQERWNEARDIGSRVKGLFELLKGI